jgi:hypothetical protein
MCAPQPISLSTLVSPKPKGVVTYIKLVDSRGVTWVGVIISGGDVTRPFPSQMHTTLSKWAHETRTDTGLVAQTLTHSHIASDRERGRTRARHTAANRPLRDLQPRPHAFTLYYNARAAGRGNNYLIAYSEPACNNVRPESINKVVLCGLLLKIHNPKRLRCAPSNTKLNTHTHYTHDMLYTFLTF